MIDSIRQFISDSLVEMDCAISGIGGNSQLEYGLKFGEEETERLAGLTVGEFCGVVAERMPARTLVE